MLHAAINEILQRLLVLRQLEAYAVRRAPGQLRFQLLRRQIAALVVVARHLTGAESFLAQEFQTTLRAKAAIGAAVLQQAIDGFAVAWKLGLEIIVDISNTCSSPVQLGALALDVWSVVPAKARALVYLNASPEQIFDQTLRGARHQPSLIRVLDAQQKLAAGMPRI